MKKLLALFLLAVSITSHAQTVKVDGSSTVFVASDINLLLEDSTIRDESVEVYVGGILQTSGYTITGDNPAEVTFDESIEELRKLTEETKYKRKWN